MRGTSQGGRVPPRVAMTQHYIDAHQSCLRRCVGLRVNLFRAMHDPRFFVADDQSVLAVRVGDYALTACVAFDEAFAYFYVRDCSWYRCDLSRLADDDVPDHVRHELLRQLAAVLG